MIDFNDIISDESFAAYIDGAANSFESLKIDASLPSSALLSEVYDITKSAQEIGDLSDFAEAGLDNIKITEIIEKINNKIK